MKQANFLKCFPIFVLIVTTIQCIHKNPINQGNTAVRTIQSVCVLGKGVDANEVDSTFAFVKGDGIKDSAVFELKIDLLSSPKEFYGTFELPMTGSSWTVIIRMYDNQRRKIGEGYLKLDDTYFNAGKYTANVSIEINSAKPTIDTCTADNLLVGVNDTIRLQGTGTDETAIVKYEWKIGDGKWMETTSGDTSFVAPSITQVLKCIFRVTDKNGLTGFDSVSINVVNGLPTAIISAPDSAVAFTPFLVNAKESISGAFCKIIKYEWSFSSDSNFIEGSGNDTLILASTSDKYPAYYVVILKVTDEENNVACDTQFVYRKKGWHCLKDFNGSIVNVIVNSKDTVFVQTVEDGMHIFKYTGVDWLPVGESRPGQFYIDKNDDLYLCTIDMLPDVKIPDVGSSLNQIFGMWRFDGNKWMEIGNRPSAGSYVFLFDNNGIPVFVGFDLVAKQFFLCKLTDGDWVRENIIVEGLNSKIHVVCNFAIDKNNKQYISCSGNEYGNDTIYTLTKNDTAWEIVEKFIKPGRFGNKAYPEFNVKLFFDNNNIMYNCFSWGYPGCYFDTYFYIGRKTNTGWDTLYTSKPSRWVTEFSKIGFDEGNNFYFNSVENIGPFINKLNGKNVTVIDNEIENISQSSGWKMGSFKLKKSNLLWVSYHFGDPKNVIFHMYDGVKKTDFNVTSVWNWGRIGSKFVVDIDSKDVMYMSSGNRICIYK